MVIRAFHYRGVSMSVPEEGASTTAGVSESPVLSLST